MTTNPVLLVLGAGPGLGLAVARRFGRDGYDVALAGRSTDSLAPLGTALGEAGVRATLAPVDLTDPAAVTDLVTRIGTEAGRIDVLHFNPSAFRMKDPLHLTVDELLDDIRLGVAPLLPAVQAARPFMSAGARVLVTGSAAADRPWNEAASLGVQKAAVRNLVISLDTTLEPDGIRAVAVQVNGTLAEEGPFSPASVADALHAAATRPDEGWTAHVPYDG
jgi:NAD(P)-dependent dehydrogenase (short-subunit alcohol dehydrogenase family)